ncbi:uncharacterized protein LOC116952011 [Petromyzon marinus]|uniref:Uncharacterized protein LOC116952011 n=1 Tax=Petromyzon marinus TaxID=7757 RepID=A0AAJ7XA67_PETMA|nr:uncharacterized protein LOC116952011 [Petromyzon marinus]
MPPTRRRDAADITPPAAFLRLPLPHHLLLPPPPPPGQTAPHLGAPPHCEFTSSSARHAAVDPLFSTMGARSQPCHARCCCCRCGHLRLLLLLLLVSGCAAGDAADRVTPSSSSSTAAAGETMHAVHPSSEEMQHKCGFTLEGISECRDNRCREASTTCLNIDNPAACVVERCEQALAECERPLNANLSAEAVCERDGFAKVTTNCITEVSKSKDTFSHCKTKGYLQVRRRCFSSTWRKLVQQAATERTGAMNFTDDFFDCVDKNCISQSESCPEKNSAYIKNVSARIFTLEGCTYSIATFPQECENPLCPRAIDVCFKRFSSAGLMVTLAVIVLLLLALAVAFIVRRGRKHFHHPRSNNSVAYVRVI